MTDTSTTNTQYAISAEENVGSAIFFFAYLTDEGVSMQADITDNFVETNYAVQDHIALKPRIIHLKGLIGEVVTKKRFNSEDFLQRQLE